MNTVEETSRTDRIADRLHVIAVMDYLAQKTSLDDMTVNDICSSAKISRTSFYRMFEDKYDAANWFMFRCLDLGNTQTGRRYGWYDGNLVTLSGCLLMKNIMGSAWRSQGYHAMKETGIRRKYADLVETIKEYRHIELTDELDFQCDSFAHSESYMVRTWIREDSPRPVEEMATYIDRVVPPLLHEALDRPIDPRPAEKLTLGGMLVALS